jgi:hypothetical protein
LPQIQNHIPSVDASPPASQSVLKATPENEQKPEALPPSEKARVENCETTDARDLIGTSSRDAGTNIQDLIEYIPHPKPKWNPS